MIRSTKNVQIRIRNNKTTCTIVKVTPEDEGTYLCKATSDIGVTTTKAKLYVQELTLEEREQFELKQAQEEKEEKIRLERVKLEKTEHKRKRRGVITFETEGKRESTDVQEVQILESASQFTESTEQVKAQRILSVRDSVEVSAIASCKKVDETVQEMKTPLEKAQKIVPVQESVTVSEIQTEDTVKDLKQRKVKKAVDKRTTVEESVTVSEVKPERKEFVQRQEIKEKKEVVETKEIVQKRKVIEKKKVEIAEKILEEEKTKIATEVEELMSFIQAREFGPGESPLRDLARIGFLVRRGVAVNEITTLYQADRFPALQTPVAQSALVQLVEREGHGALISQVLTEETTTDETLVGETVGFHAFMRMVELKHAAVEEVITHFAPEDFRPIEWDSQEAVEVMGRNVITERANIIRETEVQARKECNKNRSCEVSPNYPVCTLPFLFPQEGKCLLSQCVVLIVLFFLLLRLVAWFLGVIIMTLQIMEYS